MNEPMVGEISSDPSKIDVSRIPVKLLQELARAIDSQRWLISIFHCNYGLVQLDRTANDFPSAEIDTAARLFAEDTQLLKAGK